MGRRWTCVLAGLGDADDDVARTDAITGGFDRLVQVASVQVVDVTAATADRAL